ncbi:MAG: C10 family peptidase [Muribaculaceae bacterium]|nr:C10 family peptidase [Muribaculaceae bacterium]
MATNLRRLLISSLTLGLTVPVFAEKVEINEAMNTAIEFISAHTGLEPKNVEAVPVYSAGTAAHPLYYVFNIADNGGFVIISAEECATPVLGFSFEGNYPVNDTPEAMKWMMAGLERELLAAPTVQSALNAGERRGMARAAARRAAAKNLSTPAWSQEGPFNSMIPGRPLVGCVGTAMAEIMRYYQYPVAGTGSFGGVDFDSTYDWSSMRTDNYRSGYSSAEADAVALLMLHASKSIDTQYAMSGSSAYEVRVPGALSTYFGYDPGISYKKRSEVATQAEWDRIVKDEIDAGRPVLYCGQDVTAGHAFVCDGYQGDYLHFNWGWGGSANGYFLSTALNPTVSRTHNYNNLNTIIYNIKPANGMVKVWSPIHITADGNQPGIGSDMTDLASGKSFTLRVGNLKNLSYDNFSGKIAVALCASDGSMKALLSPASGFSLHSMATLANGYIDFRNCSLPAGTMPAADDCVRIMTLADGASHWLPVAGELPTVNELSPAVAAPASFSISLPAAGGYTAHGMPEVIRGWNYSFTVTPENPAEDVLTVKANGYVLTPNGDTYTIANVRENQEITVLVQKAADVKEKRSVWVAAPGQLASTISEAESGTIKELSVFGTIDATDFAFIRSAMRLTSLDLSGAIIAANGANQANAIPREAFRGLRNLKSVTLPASVNRLNNGCFRECGITSITIPANVKTYEYNVFCGASSLRDIYVGRANAEFINWCVLSGVKVDACTLHVPNESAVANYSNAENWNTIANIVVDPIKASDDALFAVMDHSDVKFDSDMMPGRVAKGTAVSFKATHIGNNDNNMQVYANNTLLKPDAEGRYSTVINANTILHFDLVAPMKADAPSFWSLTGANGSVGMLSEAVNVIPGQDFTVRVNALNIPEGYDQMFWAMVLTDAEGGIKEFISPVNVWTGGVGPNHKFNVVCRVNDSEVREGNVIRLATSPNKKSWGLVKAEGEGILAGLPAINNVTPVHTITIPEVKGASVSGAVASAIHGRDITLKVTPNSPSHRVNMSVNGVPVAVESPSVNYTFVAMQDMTFEISVIDPKAEGAVTYNVQPGELYKAVTEASVRPNVIVTGSVYANDLSSAFRQNFAAKTIKKLDLSGVTIVANPGNSNETANKIPANLLYNPSGINPIIPVVEEIKLPDSVEMIEEAAFNNCANLKEITLPMSLKSCRFEVGRYASGNIKYGYSIGKKAFQGCTSLTTIYVPGPLNTVNGKKVVSHFYPVETQFSGNDYDLGHPDTKKVTIVVPASELNVYTTEYRHMDNGNPWKYYGYNILSENPVYGVTFDPSRIRAAEGFDVDKAASFLGNDVATESMTVSGKLSLVNPEANCVVLDNGKPVTPDTDGTIPVTFYNPAKKAGTSGNHEIKVVYLHEVDFRYMDPIFAISVPEVTNADGIEPTYEKVYGHVTGMSNVAENSTVRFKLTFNPEHPDGLTPRVMWGKQELTPDEEGYYSMLVNGSERLLDIYAVPGEGARLNGDEISAINPVEAAVVTSIALSGEIDPAMMGIAMESFPALRSLDLSEFIGELPPASFSRLNDLENIVLPRVETIPENLFEGCSKLTTIDIPATVNHVGAEAFKGCSSLKSIFLTGVSSIGAGAFKGCSSLTSLTLLADNTASAAQAPARAPRRAADVHSEAFDGLNPNCIVVLDQGVAVPAARANYLTTSVANAGNDAAGSDGRVYSAAGSIRLSEGYPLSIPHSFTVADGASVSMECDLNEWNALVMPFDVETVTNAYGDEMPIYNNLRRAAGSEYLQVFGFGNDDENMGRLNAISANDPCVVYSPVTGKATFSTSAGTVPATPQEAVAQGADYSVNASYTERELPAAETYFLNEDGSAFEQAGTDGTVTVKPFEVYATSPVATDAIYTELPSTDITTDVEMLRADGLGMIRNGNSIVIDADADRNLTIYSTDGCAVMTIALKAGRNEIPAPAPGIYVIGGSKIRF